MSGITHSRLTAFTATTDVCPTHSQRRFASLFLFLAHEIEMDKGREGRDLTRLQNAARLDIRSNHSNLQPCDRGNNQRAATTGTLLMNGICAICASLSFALLHNCPATLTRKSQVQNTQNTNLTNLTACSVRLGFTSFFTLVLPTASTSS